MGPVSSGDERIGLDLGATKTLGPAVVHEECC